MANLRFAVASRARRIAQHTPINHSSALTPNQFSDILRQLRRKTGWIPCYLMVKRRTAPSGSVHELISLLEKCKALVYNPQKRGEYMDNNIEKLSLRLSKKQVRALRRTGTAGLDLAGHGIGEKRPITVEFSNTYMGRYLRGLLYKKVMNSDARPTQAARPSPVWMRQSKPNMDGHWGP